MNNIWFWVIIVIVVFMIATLKGLKDPDVKIANKLRIPIIRYRKYKEWYDEHQRLMRKYGTDSKEANEYFDNFIQHIQNKNEWRKYQDYRYQEIIDDMNDMINKL